MNESGRRARLGTAGVPEVNRNPVAPAAQRDAVATNTIKDLLMKAAPSKSTTRVRVRVKLRGRTIPFERVRDVGTPPAVRGDEAGVVHGGTPA